MSSINEQILLCGHTHTPLLRHEGGKTLLNPGSVGNNFGGDFCAEYAVLTLTEGGAEAEFCRVPYDFEAFKRTCDLTNPWVNVCVKSTEDGINYNVNFIKRIKELSGEWPVPDEVWNGAFEEFLKDGNI